MAQDDAMEVEVAGGANGGVEESKGSASLQSHSIHAPNFDLDSYAARYTGHTKVQRLLFIAERSKPLELDAYKLALDSLKAGMDTEAYKKVVDAVGGRLGSAYALDLAWLEREEKRAIQTRDRLDNDLQASKSSVAKESIRLGYTDLGEFCYRRGDLDGALKNYVRTRDYCHITRHIIDMCLNVIKVAVALNSWAHVNNYVSKAEHTSDLGDPVALSKLKAAAGLSQLFQEHYAAAAKKFLECSSEHLSYQDKQSPFSEVIAPEDVALYGALCALATFERDELKRRLVDSINFKGFLDLVPQVRELVYDFVNSRYGSCLRYLGELQPELMLDLHLHKHVQALYKKIRDRCLLQFFTPYLSVDLRRMAGAFNMEVEALELEVAHLIMASHLPARIDSEKKTLLRRQVNKRDEGYKKVLGMGQDFLREVRSMLLRMSLLEHGLVVEGRPGRGSASAALQQGDPMSEEVPEEIMGMLGVGGGLRHEDNQQDPDVALEAMMH